MLWDLFDCCFALKLILFLWRKWCWVILDATFLLIIATITIMELFWMLIFILTLFVDLFFRLFLYFNQFFNYFCIEEMVAFLDLATTMITWTLFIRRAVIVWYIFVFEDYLLLRWIEELQFYIAHVLSLYIFWCVLFQRVTSFGVHSGWLYWHSRRSHAHLNFLNNCRIVILSTSISVCIYFVQAELIFSLTQSSYNGLLLV